MHPFSEDFLGQSVIDYAKQAATSSRVRSNIVAMVEEAQRQWKEQLDSQEIKSREPDKGEVPEIFSSFVGITKQEA